MTPQVRLTFADGQYFQKYVDFGIGAHVLSGHHIGDRQLGTNFQFGEYVGVGTKFDGNREYAASVRLAHESNGGTNSTNNGLTTVGLRFEYTWP